MPVSHRIEYQRQYRNQIVTIVCKQCGLSFQRRRGQAKYCEPCGLSIRTARFCAQVKTTLVCQQCGLAHQPGHLNRQFCSLVCKGKASQGKPNAKRGGSYPHLRRAAERDCLCCGTRFRAIKDHKGKKQVYCSHPCYLKNRRVSLFELAVGAMLRGRGLSIETTVKRGRWTFDIAVVGTPILVEADGTFWHSSAKVKERDARKDEWCRVNGYDIIRITEASFRADPVSAGDVILKRAEAENLTCEKVA